MSAAQQPSLPAVGPRRILFIAEGSRGDCQPYLALARGLKEAGFVLQFLTNVNHCETYKSSGFDAVGVSDDSEEQLRINESVRDAMESGNARKLFECHVEVQLPTFEEVLRKCCVALEDFKPDLIAYGVISRPLANSLSFRYGIPAVGTFLQLIAATRFEPSVVNEPSWLPGWCHLAAQFLAITLYLHSWERFREIQKKVLPEVDPYMNSLAKQLVNIGHPLLKPIVGASPLLNKVPPDLHPDSIPLMTGAWVLDAAAQMSLVPAGSKLFGNSEDAKDTLAFLEDSSSAPPVYLGWGSMIAVSPEHMARLAVRTLMVLGRRGIIVGGFAELNESMLEGERDLQEYASKNVRFIAAAPHEILFPKCAALVHHGGAGTLNAALRSGVPQVITPCFGDQFSNAAKVNALKTGVGLGRFQKCTVEELVKALRLVLSDSAILENAQQYGKEFRKEEEMSIGLAVNEIKRDFVEEIDTGNWKAKFEARKLLFETSEKAMSKQNCCAWVRRIFFSTAPNDFLTCIE